MDSTTILSKLDMASVREHYLHRRKIRHSILTAFDAKEMDEFARLALGTHDPAGNYSAAEHNLGIKIITSNGSSAVFALASTLNGYVIPRSLPTLLSTANLKYLKISVGSELSMMLNPDRFWTTNVRTVWSHLLIETGDNYEKANDALSIYRGNKESKDNWDGVEDMSYQLWSDMHVKLESSLKHLGALGKVEAMKQGVQSGKLTFLWSDAIANELYSTKWLCCVIRER